MEKSFIEEWFLAENEAGKFNGVNKFPESKWFMLLLKMFWCYSKLY